MSETVCPLCSQPRPRGAKQCICNYTFEYEAPRRRLGQAPSRKQSGDLTAIIASAAVMTALIAGWLAHRIEPKPTDAMVPAIMIGAGLFALAGAFGGWSWFLSDRRARKFVWLFGAAGARVFYALLGGAMAGGGLGFLA